MPVIEGTTKVKTAVGLYDFAVDGGAVSTITLRSLGMASNVIPNGSVITGGYIDIQTALTSGGAATIGANSEAAGDIVAAATAVATWSLGRKTVLPADTTGSAAAGTQVKLTAARSITITIAAFALTAGKFTLVLEYV